MSKRTYTDFVCDGCGQTTEPLRGGVRLAQGQAHALGWRVMRGPHGLQSDFCGECAAARIAELVCEQTRRMMASWEGR
jgi:hypothetical protein